MRLGGPLTVCGRSGRRERSHLPDRSGAHLLTASNHTLIRFVLALALTAGAIAGIDLTSARIGATNENSQKTCQDRPLVWEAPTGLKGDSQPAADGGLLFVPMAGPDPGGSQAEGGAGKGGFRTRIIRALREDDGRVIWHRYFQEGVWEQSLTAKDGVLLAGGSGGRLFALEARSGRLIWSLRLEGEVNSAPAMEGGVAYVATSHVGPGLDPNPHRRAWVYAINLSDGRIIWQVETENFGFASPVYHNGTLYAGGGYLDEPELEEGGYTGIYALDAATGRIKWRHRSPDGFVKSMVGTNTVLAFVGYTDFVYGLDARTGKVLWTYPTGNWAPAVSGSPRLLFVGSANGFIHALDPATGRAIWRHNLEGVFNYPVGAVVPYAGSLYTVTTLGDVISLAQANGVIQWRAKMDAETRAAPVVTKSRILIHTTDGRLTAYPTDAAVVRPGRGCE